MSRFISVKSFGLSLLAVASLFAGSTFASAQSAEAGSAGSDSARSLIRSVDAGQAVVLKDSAVAIAADSEDLGVVDADHEISGVQLVLRRSKEQQLALQQLMGRTTDANDPLYGTAVEPGVFNETFGVAKADVQGVSAWLASAGVRVTEVKFGGKVMVLSGKAIDFEAAFGVELHNYVAPDGTRFFANTSALKVPASLRHTIQQALGLQNYAAQGEVEFDGPRARGLSANGVTANLAQTSYPAPNTTVGVTSATQSATLAFSAQATVSAIAVLTQGTANLDFKYVAGGTCKTGTPYAQNATCTVFFSFTPAYPGQRLGAVQLTTSSGAVAATSFVNGVGVSALGAFPGGGLTTISSTLSLPRGVSVDASGDVFVADSGSGNVYKYVNGTGTPITLATGMSSPVATVVDGAGNLYISAQNGNAIYELPGGASATAVATPTKVASINFPDDALVADGAGNVYFASSPSSANSPNCPSQFNVMAAGTHTLTTLLALNYAIPGLTNATMGRIIGEAIDASGNLFLADFMYNRLYKMAAGTTTLTVLVNSDGKLDNPHGIVVDNAGNLFVTNYDGNPYLLRYGYVNGTTYTETTFSTALSSVGIVLDGSGNFFLLTGATQGVGALYKFTRTTTPVLAFPSTAVGSSSAQQVVGFENDGNAALTITSLSGVNANFNGAGTTCSTATALAIAGTCTFGVEFAPTTVSAALSGSANVTDNTLSAAGTVQVIQISGPSTGQASTTSNVNGVPSSVTYGAGTSVQTFATVVGAAGAPQPTGSVQFSGTTVNGGPLTATISAANCTSTGSGASLVYSCTVSVSAIVPVATAAGIYTTTATYSGDTHYATSTGTGSETVNGATPGTVSISAVSVAAGSTTGVTVTASESGSSGAVTGGVVTFSVNSPATGSFSPTTCTLTLLGSCTTTYTPTGTQAAGTYQSVQATFAAVGNYAAATATNSVTLTAVSAASATVSAVSTPYSSTTGVTVTATETGTGGAVTGGVVTFSVISPATGSFSPATCNLSSAGSCSTSYVPTGSLAAGTYTNDIKASFAAVGIFTTATATSTLTVSQASATFGTMSFTPTTVAYGTSSAVVITDSLSYAGTIAPTGAVTFVLNGVTYTATCTGSSSPLSCSASVPAATVAALAAGSYTVTAAVAGTSNYASSTGTSGSFTVTNQTPVLSTISATPSPSTYGVSTSLSLSETIAYTGAVAPTGAVSFTLNGVTYPATCTLSSTSRSCTATVPAATVAGLVAGSYPLTSSEAASTDYAPATGSGTFVVGKGTATFGTMTFSPTSIQYGASAPVTISDTLSYTGLVAPTGAVTFVVDNYTFNATCTGNSSPLTCSATAPTGTVAQAAIGTYTVTPNFAGDSNYNPSTGTPGNFSVTIQTPVLGAITASPASVAYGSSTAVVLSENVSYQGYVGPGGPLTFTLNGVNYTATCTSSGSPQVCTATVPAATVAALAVNTYAVTSVETASGNFSSATGSGSFQVTTGVPTFGTVTLMPVNTVPYGTSQAITISVPLYYSGTVAPTGAVTFSGDGNTWTATCTGSSSPLTCTATILANTVHVANVGVYPITPSIAAGGSYGTGSGASSNFTVTKGNITFGATTTLSPAGSEPYATSQAVTFTNSLSYLGVMAPTGTVSVTIGGTSYTATCMGSGSPLSCSYTLPAATVAGLAAGSYAITWNDTTDANYLAVSLAQTNSFVITQAPGGLTLVAATPGTKTTGVTSTLLTATMAPALSGVTVTFTDATTGVVLGTGSTNASGVATLTVTTGTTGVSAGLNNFQASYAATSNYAAATSTASIVYLSGILLTVDLYHDFSTNPGTYDGAPVCNGSNGTAGSTCTNTFGVVVFNFTTSTQVVTETFTNSASRAFTSATNCPTAGLATGKTCNIVFYYNPPFGDGCSLSSNCTTPAGQSGPQGTFEQATWSISASGQITGIGDAAFDRAGATSFPAQLVGKALLAPGNSLAMTPQTLTFGPQAPGTVPATQNIFVTNTGSSSQSVTYTLPASPFTTINNCGAVLAAGTTCEIQVSYSSNTVSSSSGSVVATPEVGNAITALVSGTTSTNGGLALTTNAHSYGSVTDGSSVTFGLGIKNNAATAATLSFTNAATSGYTFKNACPNPLPAGASCQVAVTFAPTAPGAAGFALTVHSSVFILPGGTGSGSTFTDVVSFSGTGVAGGTLTATSTGHNFGTLPVGSEATAYGVELSNNTSVALTLSMGGGTFASNGAAAGYTMQTNCPASLAVNANCEVVYSFTPKAVGSTKVAYPISATGGGTTYPMSSGGATATSISLSGTGE